MIAYKKPARRAVTAAAGLAVAVAMTGCGGDSGTEEGTIEVWAHSGQAAEAEALQGLVEEFNASQEEVTADLTLIPEADYTSTVQSTSPDDLPAAMIMDAPTMAAFAYDRKLIPLEGVVSQETLDNRISGIEESGTYNGETYAIGQFDVGLGLWGNRALLEEAGVEIPATSEEAWTVEEFGDVLETLSEANESGMALDLGEANGFAAEWGTFTTTPDIWSAGGTLILDGEAEGVINSSTNVETLEEWASWKPYTDPNTDGNALQDGRVAMSVTGNWIYPTFSEALGDDLVLMPLPDFGLGTKTGHGSWQWGVTPAAEDNTEAAGQFIDFLMTDESIATMTEANAAVPGTTSALEQSEMYGEGGPLELFANGLAQACGSENVTEECIAVARPVTPGYPTITSAFGSALLAIWGGADVQGELDSAARAIDSDFADNDGYQQD